MRVIYSLMLLASANVFLATTAVVRAQSGPVEARVTSVTGFATISGNGRGTLRLQGGVVLVPGDEIDTRAGGRVVIDISDGSQVVVLPGSRVIIADYANATSLRDLLQIVVGRIRVRINHFKGKPNPYRIKSPTASIAVRGTEFEVSVASKGETRVVVINGLVEVSSLKDLKRRLIAAPGHGVIVRADYTLDSFLSDVLTKKTVDRNERRITGEPGDDGSGGIQSSDTLYERSVARIIERGETALPVRFTAFSDLHLDSLENPAYSTTFTKAEGRIYVVPSLNGSGSGDEIRERLGLRRQIPIDYKFVPAGSVFVPIERFKATIGGGFSFARSGAQSLTADDNSLLQNPPFASGTTGLRTVSVVSTDNIFRGSLIFARRFGNRDRTSIGFGIERAGSIGNIDDSITQSDTMGIGRTDHVLSRYSVRSTKFTVGAAHDFDGARLGAYYRYSTSNGRDEDTLRVVNNVSQAGDLTRSLGSSSEIGFRLRGVFTPRLFYGAESSFVFGRSFQDLRRTVIVNSTERSSGVRATFGLGLGFSYDQRTVFSFDVGGGVISRHLNRFETLTGNLLEADRNNTKFLSLHVAGQRDVWRNLFMSVSLMALMESHTSDVTLHPDRFGRLLNNSGIFVRNGQLTNLFSDLYSNYGVGWRFKSDLVLQYVLTTDYGQSSPRHIFIFRHTFGSRKEDK